MDGRRDRGRQGERDGRRIDDLGVKAGKAFEKGGHFHMAGRHK